MIGDPRLKAVGLQKLNATMVKLEAHGPCIDPAECDTHAELYCHSVYCIAYAAIYGDATIEEIVVASSLSLSEIAERLIDGYHYRFEGDSDWDWAERFEFVA